MNTETDPELIVLEALRATCAQTRRFNPSPHVCAAALKHEHKFADAIDKRRAKLGRTEGTERELVEVS